MVIAQESLESLLKKHFGFDEFRPLQRDIVADTLAGRDVFALLPTGAGKSLCFQLPALVREGVTVIVSPLIALMKDQVDQLTAHGVPATFLNSSISQVEFESRFRDVEAGKFKLLYVAPERLMMPAFLERLGRTKLGAFAIDEAHCISEWGHDFRPEYRDLTILRDRFPGVPIMALTATATPRVLQDIIRLMKLEDPGVHVATFNRENLTYRVIPKSDPFKQLLGFLKAQEGGGIVYCMARKTTEGLAERLQEEGIPALAYHAGLEPQDRERAHDQFISDEVPVICATVAFGMGINKPNVRFVVHYDLPRSVEGYYQETGRAGRDGLPSECVLLYSYADVARYEYFLKEKSPEQQEVSRWQLRQMARHADNTGCRRRYLLKYFGEQFDAETCGNCDNCLRQTEGAPEWTVVPPKPVTKKEKAANRVRKPKIEYDQPLFDRLDELRSRLAEKASTPPRMIFGDHALRQMAREYPQTDEQFTRVSGVSRVKLRELVPHFQRVIADHVRSHPQLSFAPFEDRDEKIGDRKRESIGETVELYRRGLPIQEIAAERGFQRDTIINHLALAIQEGEEIDVGPFISEEGVGEVKIAFRELGDSNLTWVREQLDERFTYEALKICRALWRREAQAVAA